MIKEALSLGKTGESLAEVFLIENGYKILRRNYNTKLGEVDIIAEERGTICFIEVKSRSNNRFGSAKEAVSLAKQRKIGRVAFIFLKENNYLRKKARFDVVSIDFSIKEPNIDLIKNAFKLNEELFY